MHQSALWLWSRTFDCQPEPDGKDLRGRAKFRLLFYSLVDCECALEMVKYPPGPAQWVIWKLAIVFFAIGYAAKYYPSVFRIIWIHEPAVDIAG